MQYTGKIHGNTVVLDERPDVPDGTMVRVVILQDNMERKPASDLARMLLTHAGVISGLPDDISENHDHYLYGLPKR